MSKKQHLVLALNDSEHSKHAFQWALDHLVRLPDHKVTLLTVVEPPIQAGYYYAASAGTGTNRRGLTARR